MSASLIRVTSMDCHFCGVGIGWTYVSDAHCQWQAAYDVDAIGADTCKSTVAISHSSTRTCAGSASSTPAGGPISHDEFTADFQHDNNDNTDHARCCDGDCRSSCCRSS
jgi:hypothetical protein